MDNFRNFDPQQIASRIAAKEQRSLKTATQIKEMSAWAVVGCQRSMDPQGPRSSDTWDRASDFLLLTSTFDPDWASDTGFDSVPDRGPRCEALLGAHGSLFGASYGRHKTATPVTTVVIIVRECQKCNAGYCNLATVDIKSPATEDTFKKQLQSFPFRSTPYGNKYLKLIPRQSTFRYSNSMLYNS
ncbi:predicted protein [Histoplasma capsulatum var. duboisii H88]|uniref:Predicted protein n=2 Tax=Ajellomyces capsulatus TaxID=5037 RepID=F0UBE2_AJEC8|nr:predicted protein [Histoplasma capsulatum H143]EGC43051.1 predicted protein [Histoplasma capsulatum var. duboisii H88]